MEGNGAPGVHGRVEHGTYPWREVEGNGAPGVQTREPDPDHRVGTPARIPVHYENSDSGPSRENSDSGTPGIAGLRDCLVRQLPRSGGNCTALKSPKLFRAHASVDGGALGPAIPV